MQKGRRLRLHECRLQGECQSSAASTDHRPCRFSRTPTTHAGDPCSHLGRPGVSLWGGRPGRRRGGSGQSARERTETVGRGSRPARAHARAFGSTERAQVRFVDAEMAEWVASAPNGTGTATGCAGGPCAFSKPGPWPAQQLALSGRRAVRAQPPRHRAGPAPGSRPLTPRAPAAAPWAVRTAWQSSPSRAPLVPADWQINLAIRVSGELDNHSGTRSRAGLVQGDLDRHQYPLRRQNRLCVLPELQPGRPSARIVSMSRLVRPHRVRLVIRLHASGGQQTR